MAITIEHSVAIRSSAGKQVWSVKPQLMQKIDGTTFVKLQVADMGFVRLVCDGTGVDVPKNATLRQTQGIKQLMQPRKG